MGLTCMDRTKIVVEAEVIAQSGCYHVLRGCRRSASAAWCPATLGHVYPSFNDDSPALEDNMYNDSQPPFVEVARSSGGGGLVLTRTGLHQMHLCRAHTTQC